MLNFVAHGGQIAWDELLMLALPLVLLFITYRRLVARPGEQGDERETPDPLAQRSVTTPRSRRR